MNLISDTTTKMAKAELIQLMRPFTKINEKEYLEIVVNKTASLFAAAIKTGAILAGADKNSAMLLYDYGMKLGIAFQIIDDALDEVKEYEFNLDAGQGKSEILPYKLVLSDYNLEELKPLLEKFNQEVVDKLSTGESVDIRLVLKENIWLAKKKAQF